MILPVEIVLMIQDLGDKPSLSVLNNLALFVELVGQKPFLSVILARYPVAFHYGEKLLEQAKQYKDLVRMMPSLSLHYDPKSDSRDDSDRRQGLALLAMTESLTRLDITIPKAKWELMPHFRWYPEAKKALIHVTELVLAFDENGSASLENVLRVVPNLVDLSLTFCKDCGDYVSWYRGARPVGLPNLSRLEIKTRNSSVKVPVNVLRKHFAILTLNRIESLLIQDLHWLTAAVFDTHFDQLKRLEVENCDKIELLDMEALKRIRNLNYVSLPFDAAKQLHQKASAIQNIWAKKQDGSTERLSSGWWD